MIRKRANKKPLARIPKKRQSTNLAALKEIRFHSLDGRKRTIKFDKKKWELLWYPAEKYLLVVQKKDLKKLENFDNKNYKHFPAYKMWKIFTDKDFNQAFTLDLYKDKKFNKIGKGIHVVYHSDKWNPGDFWDYIHEFGEGIDYVVVKNHGVNISYDPINKIYKMSGGKLDVTDRGIIN